MITSSCIVIQTDRRTDRQADRQTGGQTARVSYRWIFDGSSTTAKHAGLSFERLRHAAGTIQTRTVET